MDLEARAQTIKTYTESAQSLAEYYDRTDPRSDDIDKAMSLWGRQYPPVVVEIGCGSGRDAQEILKHTPYYLGFDISPGMVDRARSVLFGGVVMLGDVRYAFEAADQTPNGPFIPDGIDIIFSFASLLHSDEDEVTGVLQDAAHKLTTGGIFYISLKLGEGSFYQDDEYGTRVFYLYTPERIKQMAGDLYESVHEDYQTIGSTEWFTIALKKV